MHIPHILEELVAEIIVTGGVGLFIYFKQKRKRCNHTIKKLEKAYDEAVDEWYEDFGKGMTLHPNMPEQWAIDFIKKNTK